MSGFVYFIRVDTVDGPIKIGRSLDPAKRLGELATQIPWGVTLLAQVSGDWAMERNIQDCFADAHMRGEWFRPIPRLLEAIERIQAGSPAHEAIDLSARLGNTLGLTIKAAMKRNGTTYAGRARRAA